MSNLSRRTILSALPVVALPSSLALAAPLPSADAEIIALAARILPLAAESDVAVCERSDREDAASDDYPIRPALFAKAQPHRRDHESVERLQAWLDELTPDDMPYRDFARRLANMKVWQAECDAIDARHGVPAARERADRINDLLLEDLVPALTDMQPATIAGIGAKADTLVALESWGVIEPTIAALSKSIIADVRRLAGGANV